MYRITLIRYKGAMTTRILQVLQKQITGLCIQICVKRHGQSNTQLSLKDTEYTPDPKIVTVTEP
jgi:hypothetical protein